MIRTAACTCSALAALAISGAAGAAVPTAVPLQLSAPGIAASDVQGQFSSNRPKLSPDGKWVVYVHDPVVHDALQLYAVPRAGGAPVRLSAALPPGITVVWFDFAANGRVLYLVDQETPGKRELWSVPIGGPSGASVKLSPTLLPPAGTVAFTLTTLAQISADGRWVAFVADATTAGVKEVWSAPTDGSAPAVQLSPAPESGGGVTAMVPFQLAPDSSRVAFTGKFQGAAGETLWSAPLDGSAVATRISFAGANSSRDVAAHAFTPDSSQIVFIEDREIDGRYELYRRMATGGTGTQLSPNSVTSPTANGAVTGFTIAPDGSRAVFIADIVVDGRFDLWSVPLDGSAAAAMVSPALVTGREVSSPLFSPDSARVAFLADAGSDDVQDLWSVPADGSASAVRINPVLSGEQDVSRFAFSDDSTRLVYATLESPLGLLIRHIWSNDATGPSAAAFEISTGPNSDRSVTNWLLAGTNAVLVGDLDVDGDSFLYRAPIDGSIGRKKIAGSHTEHIVDGMQLTGGGSYVAYVVSVAGTLRLREAAIAGGGTGSSWLLDPQPLAGSGVQLAIFWPTAVGHGVFWVGSYATNGHLELWIADHPLLAEGFESGLGGFTHN